MEPAYDRFVPCASRRSAVSAIGLVIHTATVIDIRDVTGRRATRTTDLLGILNAGSFEFVLQQAIVGYLLVRRLLLMGRDK